MSARTVLGMSARTVLGMSAQTVLGMSARTVLGVPALWSAKSTVGEARLESRLTREEAEKNSGQTPQDVKEIQNRNTF